MQWTLQPVFPGESFENKWFWTAKQSEIAGFNVIRFLTIKISLGILF